MGDSHGRGGQGHDENGHSAGKGSHDEKNFMVDNIFNRITSFVSDKIAKLVLFLFIILTIGAIIGYVIALRRLDPLWLFAPLLLGIFAYYERDIAILIFIMLVILVIL